MSHEQEDVGKHEAQQSRGGFQVGADWVGVLALDVLQNIHPMVTGIEMHTLMSMVTSILMHTLEPMITSSHMHTQAYRGMQYTNSCSQAATCTH